MSLIADTENCWDSLHEIPSLGLREGIHSALGLLDELYSSTNDPALRFSLRQIAKPLIQAVICEACGDISHCYPGDKCPRCGDRFGEVRVADIPMSTFLPAPEEAE